MIYWYTKHFEKVIPAVSCHLSLHKNTLLSQKCIFNYKNLVWIKLITKGKKNNEHKNYAVKKILAWISQIFNYHWLISKIFHFGILCINGLRKNVNHGLVKESNIMVFSTFFRFSIVILFQCEYIYLSKIYNETFSIFF